MIKYEEDNKHVKYLLNSKVDTSWGITINTVGHQQINPNMDYPTRNHPKSYLFSTAKGRILDEYQLLYVSNGSGIFHSKSYEKTKIHAGNLFFLFPEEWHTFKPDKKNGWEEYWIGFNGENINKLCETGFFSKSKPVFNIGYNIEIIELFERAIQAANEQNTGFQQVLAGIVNYMLGIIYSMNKQSFFDEQKISSKINEAKKIMHDNFQTNITPMNIAESLCLSYSHFRKIFKEYTGYSPKQYILELRINKSKELLTTTELYLKEISWRIGFENVEYFCNLFKKNVGMTPFAYRKRVRR